MLLPVHLCCHFLCIVPPVPRGHEHGSWGKIITVVIVFVVNVTVVWIFVCLPLHFLFAATRFYSLLLIKHVPFFGDWAEGESDSHCLLSFLFLLIHFIWHDRSLDFSIVFNWTGLVLN